MADDIVTRLRSVADDKRLCWDAADKIEQLEATIARLQDRGDDLELWARVQHRPDCQVSFTEPPNKCTCRVAEVTALWRVARCG